MKQTRAVCKSAQGWPDKELGARATSGNPGPPPLLCWCEEMVREEEDPAVAVLLVRSCWLLTSSVAGMSAEVLEAVVPDLSEARPVALVFLTWQVQVSKDALADLCEARLPCEPCFD